MVYGTLRRKTSVKYRTGEEIKWYTVRFGEKLPESTVQEKKSSDIRYGSAKNFRKTLYAGRNLRIYSVNPRETSEKHCTPKEILIYTVQNRAKLSKNTVQAKILRNIQCGNLQVLKNDAKKSILI